MFHFKQFDVEDSACAMKVGTDGVLLGGWAENTMHDAQCTMHVLDIGTGSGLIALMLAQRFPNAHILGIDIDEASARQAAANFAASPWSERLEAKHISLQELTGAAGHTAEGGLSARSAVFQRSGLFSLIVSNPPYFRNALKCPNHERSNARHTDSLSYDELLRCAEQLLTEDGVLALILPAEAESDIITLAVANGLHPLRLTRVHTTLSKPAKRILLSLVPSTIHHPQSTNETTLDALNEPLLRDFYQHDFRNRQSRERSV